VCHVTGSFPGRHGSRANLIESEIPEIVCFYSHDGYQPTFRQIMARFLAYALQMMVGKALRICEIFSTFNGRVVGQTGKGIAGYGWLNATDIGLGRRRRIVSGF